MAGDDLRLLAALLLAAASAVAADRLGARRGLLPPGFAQPLRRLLAIVLLAGVLLLAVFLPALTYPPPPIDPAALSTADLFISHLLLLAAVAGWTLLGFAGTSRPAAAAPWEPGVAELDAMPAGATPPEAGGLPPPVDWAGQLGLRSAAPLRDLGLGLAVGAGAWLAVVAVLLVMAGLLLALGWDEALAGGAPPALVVWLAGLPAAWRLAVSLSAGLFEELFFRGFLQPRLGIALSSLLFVLGHLSYAQPLMLVALAVLSVIYALLTRWSASIWPAVVAHALFDAVQLLVIIPFALDAVEAAGG
ncbi:MAG: CPBP family intramembrane metalloprotease [Acidobacteria bacterium]|nr:MAG: CPBP family intramembrane metalloprotease [Acidobacteriota bacterium]